MNQDKKTLIVIDGNSLLYRAFFAMRYLSTTDGQPTNAIYGLTTMLLKVLEMKPDYVAVAFDTPKPTFRHEAYADYKAHRKAVPDELLAQNDLARELIRAFNIPVIERPGFEADDIIGAMAKDAEEMGLNTVIVTGDLDALQLVTDNVTVMTTVKGVSDTVMYDPAAVMDRFGLTPRQIIDFKSLKGDTSDNIPGVPGIGEKTAVNLLKEYGDLDNILAHIQDMPEGKVKRTLSENIEIAKTSKWLATIVTDLPEKLKVEDYDAKEPDYSILRDLFVRLEFKTMLKRLPEVQKAASESEVHEKVELGACRCISSDAELKELLEMLENTEEFALQCHTSDGKTIGAEIIGISFCLGVNNTAYVQIKNTEKETISLNLGFDDIYQADLSTFAEVLENENIAKFCHDYKLNYAALALHGITLRGVVFDSMLGAYLLDATRGSFTIGDIAFEQLSLELPGVTEKKQDITADNTTIICGEAEAIYRLKPAITEKLKRDGEYELYKDVELPLAPILSDMELAGVAVDSNQLGTLSITLDADIKQLERQIFDQAGEEFNIGSPKQLQVVLFEKMGMTSTKKTKTGYSTSASALEELAVDYPIVGDILHYRELTKIKSTYADALPKLINPRTGRIHTSLNQAVTATGRLSSSDPNLQNIPVRTELGREIRKAFVASGENVLLSADYSQIELRVLAHVTGDDNLVKAFESNEDIHRATATTLFNCLQDEVTPEMRRRAKTINFAVIYGMTDFTLAKELSLSVREARTYIDHYFEKFPGVREYTESTMESARANGYVSTLMGRRRYIPEINASNRNIRLFAERAAVNMPIQGTAADIVKLAMIKVQNSLKTSGVGGKLLLQVHDELLLEVPPTELGCTADILRNGMEHAFDMRIPLKVDVKSGKNWADMELMSP